MTAATPTIVVSRSVSSGGGARATIDEAARPRPAAAGATMSCTRRPRAGCRRATPRTVGLALPRDHEHLEGAEDGGEAQLRRRVGEPGGAQEIGQETLAQCARRLDAVQGLEGAEAGARDEAARTAPVGDVQASVGP